MPPLTLLQNDTPTAASVPENETAPDAGAPRRGGASRGPLRAIAAAVGGAATLVVVIALCLAAIVTHVARAAARRRPAPALPVAATRLNAGA